METEKYYKNISSLPKSERPRENCFLNTALNILSDQQLIAILLGSGTPR